MITGDATMERRDQFRILAGFLVCASGLIFYLAFVQPAPPPEKFVWHPPEDSDDTALEAFDTETDEVSPEMAEILAERDRYLSGELSAPSSLRPGDTPLPSRSSGFPSGPIPSASAGSTSYGSAAGLFAASNPDLARRVSRAVAEGRYEAAADLVLRSPEGRRVAAENGMSEAELRSTLVAGFAYVTRDREVRNPESEVDRIMTDPRSGELIRSVGLSKEDVEYLLREYLARKEAYGTAPGNPRPIDYGPREINPR
jgi:hypothetical protein